MKKETKFYVGQRVKVVDEPYYPCEYIWVESMTAYCGKDVTIVRVMEEYGVGDGYWIAEDDGNCVWCENCFEEIAPELEIGFDDIFGML